MLYSSATNWFVVVLFHSVVICLIGFGTLSWKIDNPPADPNVQLVFYDDEANMWPQIYKKGVSCAQRLVQSKYNVSANTKNTLIEPRNVHSPHFWYVAGINCGGEVDFEYEMTFLNSWGDNKWIEQFSCDEVGKDTQPKNID